MRHVQMRQLDLSKFKKFTRSIRQKEIQIVKEQRQAANATHQKLLSISKAQRVTKKLVEPGGIEPPTSCVQGRRSPS